MLGNVAFGLKVRPRKQRPSAAEIRKRALELIELVQLKGLEKVQNFLDLTGTFDPSLIFVMFGAVVVTFIGYRLVFRRPKPVLSERFLSATAKSVDGRLVTGATLFGNGGPACASGRPRRGAPPSWRSRRVASPTSTLEERDAHSASLA